MFDDSYYMKQAINEAMIALKEDEVPVGAVVVCNDKIIARTHNQTEALNDVTAHAEILAITSASNYIGSKYLNNCTIYVTLEPCIMCAAALGWAHVGKIVYGASDDNKGFTKISPSVIHPKTLVTRGVEESLCTKIIKDYFCNKRK